MGAQSELNEMQANYEQTEMKVSQQDSGLQAKQAQVQQLKESESKAASPSSLENANAEMTEIAHQEAKESGKLKAAEAAAAQRTQEENSLKEEVKTLETRKKRLTAVEASENEQKEEETKAAAEVAKKNEVLKNVEGSWETTLKANEAAAVEEDAKKAQVIHELAAVKDEQVHSRGRQSDVELAKEHKAAKLEQAVKAVSNRAKLAKHELETVKTKEQEVVESLEHGEAEIKHEQREVEELQARKRTLIQSKLDDLDRKDAPFHDEGSEAMDKMQEANELRAEDLKKTEEEVKAATDAADAPIA